MCLTHSLVELGSIGGPLYTIVDWKLNRAGDSICLELIGLTALINHEYRRIDTILGIVSRLIVRQFILLLVPWRPVNNTHNVFKVNLELSLSTYTAVSQTLLLYCSLTGGFVQEERDGAVAHAYHHECTVNFVCYLYLSMRARSRCALYV